jgi:hypothetical protein
MSMFQGSVGQPADCLRLLLRHSREGGNPASTEALALDARLRGHDDTGVEKTQGNQANL